MLGHIELQTAQNVLSWSDVKVATSHKNTLKLFEYMCNIYQPVPLDSSDARDKENKKPNEVHSFIRPIQKCSKVTPSNAGDTMILAFHRYCEIIGSLADVTFHVKVELESGASQAAAKKFNAAELRQLRGYFFYACNACMHMKAIANQRCRLDACQ